MKSQSTSVIDEMDKKVFENSLERPSTLWGQRSTALCILKQRLSNAVFKDLDINGFIFFTDIEEPHFCWIQSKRH